MFLSLTTPAVIHAAPRGRASAKARFADLLDPREALVRLAREQDVADHLVTRDAVRPMPLVEPVTRATRSCRQIYAGFQVGVVVGFSAEDQDRLLFHTSLEGDISPVLVNGRQDVLINADQDGNGAVDGQVLVQGLVAELDTDPSIGSAALLALLIDPDTGIIDFVAL